MVSQPGVYDEARSYFILMPPSSRGDIIVFITCVEDSGRWFPRGRVQGSHWLSLIVNVIDCLSSLWREEPGPAGGSLVDWGIQQSEYLISGSLRWISSKCFCRDILIGLFASCLIWCRVQLGCQGLSGSRGVFVKQIWINSGIQFSKSRHSDNAGAGRGDTSHWQISIDTNFNSFLNQIWQKRGFCYNTTDTGLQQTNHQVSGLYWAGYLWKTGSSGTSWMMEVGVSGVSWYQEDYRDQRWALAGWNAIL